MKRATAVPFLLFLVALGVRLYGLTYHSLWFDEVVSTLRAARPAGEIWRVGLALVQDKHPPLYYLLLHGWTRIFGTGDYPVRALGSLIGALAVFPAYGVGRALGGRRAAVAGALLLAINPFLIWYSQEARMFMPATTFLLAALYGLVRLARPDPTGDGGAGKISGFATAGNLLLVVLGFAFALYAYLFSALVLPVAVSWIIVLWWPDRYLPGARRRVLLSFGALALAGLLFWPLAKSAWSVSGAEAAPGKPFAGMLGALSGLIPIYTAGWPHWPAPWPSILLAAAIILALAGLAVRDGADTGEHVTTQGLTVQAPSRPAVRPRWPHAGGLLLGLWLVLPVLCGGLLLARDRTVFAEPRYFIFLVPALCLAWGRALGALWGWAWPAAGRESAPAWRRALAVTAVGIVIAGTLLSLPSLWTGQNRREAWRETAAFLTSSASPDAAILVEPDYVSPALTRYFEGPQAVYQPFTGKLTDPAQVDPPLAGLHGFETVWLVQSHREELDPDNLVGGWFGARYPSITELYPPGIVVQGFVQKYRTPGLPDSAARSRVNATFGDLRLLACSRDPATLPARDDLWHPPSNWVHVVTYWTAANPVAGDRFPETRLVDTEGQVWGNYLERQNSTFHVWPTSRWKPNEVVRADFDVNLNPATPAGSYSLVVGLPGVSQTAACGDVKVVR